MHPSLSNESTQAATVLSSWFTEPELVVEEKILGVLCDKGSCLGKGAVVTDAMEVDGSSV
jgi:hypothetical protein